MKYFWVTTILFCGFVTTTNAQYNLLPQNYDWSASTLIQDETVKLKNPNTAMWISVGSSIGSYFLFAALTTANSENFVLYSIANIGVLVSPALGYLYTDNWNDFWSSVSRRLVGRLIMAAGALIVIIESFDNWFGEDDADDLIIAGGLALMLGGAIHNLTVTFRDYRQVRTRVEEYNENLVQSVQIMPAVDPINRAIGIGFRLNF